MPQLRRSLLVHEYDKHVQCFGFDARTFFTTELLLRRAVVRSNFGHYLTASARGRVVARAEVLHEFQHAFDTDQRAALQLRCARDHRGKVVLTQMWITLHADALERFPRRGTLMNAPIAQHNCPAHFRVPDWP
jgi:ribonuclease I